MQQVNRFEGVVRWRWNIESPLIPKPYWTSVFLADGLMFDAGAPAGAEDLRFFLRSLPPEEAPERVLLTHGHEDHAGGASMLIGEMNLPVHVHPKAVNMLRAGYDYPDYRKIAWGGPLAGAEVRPLGERVIRSRTGSFTFDVLRLPGHASCLIVPVERKRGLCFTSDLVLPAYRMIFGGSSSIREDIAEIYRSLNKLHAFTEGMERLLICTAGHDVFPEGRKLLAEKMIEIERMRERAHGLRARGLAEEEIVKEMFGGENIVSQMTKGDLSFTNMVKSLLTWSS
jgi:glyoxylase-like metal-dependent hydrolase (beta-lactamase superfamily II)